MIYCKNLSKQYDGLPVLSNVTFTINKGERVSLLGPGGCGKTTILKILLGLETKDGGKARVFNTDLLAMKESIRQGVLKKMGIAFQQGGLFDFMTVEENLMFAMSYLTLKNRVQMKATVEELLAAVKLGHTTQRYPFELSGGMRKRVGIARALCNEPEVAIFDEPTAGLDPVTSTIILKMISDLAIKTPEAALLIATSNVEIAIRFATRIVVIHNGRVIADGPWKELLLSGSKWVQDFLGVRLIGLDTEYLRELNLPKVFIEKHRTKHNTSK